MSSRELPARPHLDQLKAQAKDLLADARAGRAEAIARFALLPAFAAGRISAEALALHDAQSVIAREYGCPSWSALKDEVDARGLAFEAAVDEFVRAATGGARARAERLLALYPAIRTASLETALVLADADAVAARIAASPALARQRGGAQQWEPLLYACHTCLAGDDPQTLDALTRIATLLLAHGADPNAEYHWQWHPELPRTVLWAAVCVINYLPLAKVLLRAGARATDGVTPHITSGGGMLEPLELLQRHGLDVNGVPGGVPPLVYALTWARTDKGARWLLAHGADPNRAWGDLNETALHVAARRWDVALVETLVQHGADIHRRRADGRTPHALAILHGKPDIADWLRAQGAVDELTPLDRFVAACVRGDRASADALLATTPSLRTSLTTEHHRLLDDPAERGDLAVLDTMLACGFNPNTGDKDAVTPLHRAAMAGRASAVATLIAHGANVTALDGMFSATPLIWAVEGRNHPDAHADHVAVAIALIHAGCPMTWQAPEGAPSPERTQDALQELLAEAARREH